MHVKGILGGTEEADRHVGYLTKYLAKSVGETAGLGDTATDRQRDHARRLHAELRITPCSPRCPIWLLYGIQPKDSDAAARRSRADENAPPAPSAPPAPIFVSGARHSMTPGHCKGKAHKPEHLGIAGRRVLVSRKWSNKTLNDHRAERSEFVRQLLQQAGIQPAHGPKDCPYQWERPAPTDPDIPPRPVLLLHAIAERQRWKAEYTAAQLAASDQPPDNRSAISDQAA
jgi:hypothetical protein